MHAHIEGTFILQDNQTLKFAYYDAAYWLV